MFDPLKFAIHIIHVLYSREAETQSEVVRINLRLDKMINQNAFARDEMVRIGAAERTFETMRRQLDADIARHLNYIGDLEKRVKVSEARVSQLRGGF